MSIEVTLSTGRKVKVREPTAGEMMRCEELSLRPHPTQPFTYSLDTIKNKELAKMVTGLSEKEISEMPDKDYKFILTCISNFYESEELTRGMKAFLERLLEKKASAATSSNSPASPQQ